jgi:O-antigen ligase
MTLIRFLASKGLKKDADGVRALSDEEVQWIEAGVPTILEKNHRGLRRRLDVIQFEVWNARDGGNPSGHSLMQRFAFLDAARHIYQQHPVLGIGIGDLPSSYDEAYRALDSPLDEAFRLRAHNQYVTFLVAGGPLNLILWLVLLGALVPLNARRAHHPTSAAVLFLVVIALSCLTEDTLETQAGVTFAGFFIGLLGRRQPPQV